MKMFVYPFSHLAAQTLLFRFPKQCNMHKKYDAINLQIRLLDELYFVGSFPVDVIDKKFAIPRDLYSLSC